MDRSTQWLSNDDFNRLTREVNAGSREALGELLQQCADYLLLVANRELGRDLSAKAGASDVVQETFVQAQACIDDFQGDCPANFLSWLRQILLNQIFELRRRYGQTVMRNIARESSWNGDRSIKESVEALMCDNMDPSGDAALQDDRLVISRALDTLSIEQRYVLKLRYWENLSFAEIGRRIDRSEDAARKTWLRALERLARHSACASCAP